MADCPKCRAAMTPGYIHVPDVSARVSWFDGEAPSRWRALLAAFGIGLNPSELTARRCSACGFVEFFADPSPKPVKTLSSVEEETTQLRSMIAAMQERLAVLEAIATDPATRIAREIEDLRDRPSRVDRG